MDRRAIAATSVRYTSIYMYTELARTLIRVRVRVSSADYYYYCCPRIDTKGGKAVTAVFPLGDDPNARAQCSDTTAVPLLCYSLRFCHVVYM